MGNQHLIYERYLWFEAEIKKNRYPNARSLAEQFEISERTARRHIDFMRVRMDAPLVYDPRRRGYTYETPFSLPDLPLSQAELLAVLLAQNLISATDNGYIGRAIQQFGRKLFQKNGELGVSQSRLRQRFSAAWHGYAPSNAAIFRSVSQALLSDRLLSLTYHSPQRDQPTERVVEPHHLQHYMGSWVLLAWCRLRNDWRCFYLSRMERADLLDEGFARRPAVAWRHLLDRAFGIFQAEEVFDVRIRFSARMARWVREQLWHPEQRMEDGGDGSLILTVPAADLREIKMKILQFGGEAEVLAPAELRDLIRREAQRLVKTYAI